MYSHYAHNQSIKEVSIYIYATEVYIHYNSMSVVGIINAK
jgi:hypothetical protein